MVREKGACKTTLKILAKPAVILCAACSRCCKRQVHYVARKERTCSVINNNSTGIHLPVCADVRGHSSPLLVCTYE